MIKMLTLILGLALASRSCGQMGSILNAALPDATRHPGALNPAVTASNIGNTICVIGYSKSVRPAYSYTRLLKHDLMEAEGHRGERYSAYELDHLIPLSLGGSPADPRNIWLQPRRGVWNADKKDMLEFILWRKVCDGRVGLDAARAAIAGNWIDAYHLYVTPGIQAADDD